MAHDITSNKRDDFNLSGVKVRTRRGQNEVSGDKHPTVATAANPQDIGATGIKNIGHIVVPENDDKLQQAAQASEEPVKASDSPSRLLQRPSIHELFSDLAENAESVRILSEETLTTSLFSTQSQTLVGKVIDGRYRILEKLGEGGSGIVYKAEHIVFQQFIAIKVLHPRHASDERALRRFLQEARTVVRLRHPNAISVHEFGVIGNLPYLVMEYVEGQSLTQRILQEGPLTLQAACEYIKQISSALESAHALGIVHRDLKPDNIMITNLPDGSELVRVLDFGIAKLLNPVDNDADSSLTREGVPCGTPHYMSPEQVMAREIDHRSDLYSLGIILYEMLTGTAPFSECSPIEVMFKQIHAVPPPPSEFKPELNIPPQIEELVGKLLQKDPDQRYQSALEVAIDFARTLDDPRLYSGVFPRWQARWRRLNKNRKGSRQYATGYHPLLDVMSFALVIGLIVGAVRFKYDLRVRIGAELLRAESVYGFSLQPIKSLFNISLNLKPEDLFLCIQTNDVDGAEMLLRAGLSPDAKNQSDPEHGSALQAATITKSFGISELLLKFGADITARTESGLTPLMVAAVANDVQGLYRLLDAGADLELRTPDDKTALMIALKSGNIGASVALIYRGAYVNTVDNQLTSVLMYAVMKADVPTVEMLLDRGAPVNAKNEFGRTALWYAANRGDLALIKLLIFRGADASVKANDNSNALIQSLQWDEISIVRTLVEDGGALKGLDPALKAKLIKILQKSSPEVRDFIEKNMPS